MSAIDLNHFPNEEVSRAAVGKYGIACTLAGLLLDTFLFGMFSIELITYLNSKAKDPVWVKALVGAVVAMASLSTAHNWWIVSKFFVHNFGTYSVFLTTGPLAWLAFLDCINMSLCQAFFAYRAYRLCDRNLWIPISVGLCILTGVACTITMTVIYTTLSSVLDTHVILSPSLLWAATTMVANMIITVSILYGLMKKRSGIKSTDNLITRFIRMSLESQAATTAIALILLIDTMCVLLFHSKIYVVGLFYVLNSRHQVVVAEEITMNDTHPLAFSRTQAATIVIEQDTEMHVLRVQPPPAPGLNRNPSKSEEGDTKSQSKSEEGDTKSQSSGTAYSASPHPDHKKVAY
ncbi:hypothetical protein CcaverHIS002_0607410 [Cutaneotrichosporon cavernicola]|uniref:DUF6534 domain-containing protein n=1 Tax=Cutaneotrichosporon cavernicola TaxID=279322 RepID=A0AA48L953_9TREE|nr:uncharacterized protein CcaverHIS019_0606830 [Cutaneotrichosporon cavernicola]BEI86454.1 hypothetical protein CcaverHIS002_0607410 [Cutaneotrichosporon cavernicola]BEI94224.1 hypothetical protein CcaverHIS019_0606830 [Cutaneotrichosporon cavernicola]